MRGRGQDVDIKENVLKLLKRDEYKRGGISELRIVAWVIDGKQGQPLLERREKWVTEDGNEKLGKSKGLPASDVWIILENAPEIGKIMGIPARKIMEIMSGSQGSSETPSPSTPTEQNPQADTSMMASQDRPIMDGSKLVQTFDEETQVETPLVGAEVGIQESDPWK